MKKYLPVILLLATVTLSACGTQKNDTGKTINEESPKTESSKSLKELLGLGTSQKCTYEMNDEGEMMKGEVIVDGKRFKQTTEITNEEGSMKVYAVSDGVYYYSWSDISKEMGTKMKIEDLEKDSQEMEIGENQNNQPVKEEGLTMDQKVEYRCNPATLSEADLAIPNDVKFVDYTEMMKGLQNGNLEGLKDLIPNEGQ